MIEILSGTAFLCDGVRCQLLGISDSDDPIVRETARDFSKRWFNAIEDHFGPLNGSNPLQRPDGTCLVWLSGADMYGSRLNVELLRAGLALPDYDDLGNYEFKIPGGKGQPFEINEDWRNQLDGAIESAKRGDPPRVCFEWSGIFLPNHRPLKPERTTDDPQSVE